MSDTSLKRIHGTAGSPGRAGKERVEVGNSQPALSPMLCINKDGMNRALVGAYSIYSTKSPVNA